MFLKKKRLSAVVCVLVAALSLASCSNRQDEPVQENNEQLETVEQEKTKDETVDTNDTEDKPSEETRQGIETLAAAALEKMAVIPEYPEGFPTVDDVATQYKKAVMAVGWIVNTEKVATYSDDSYEAHGLTYYRVRPDCQYGEHELAHHSAELGDTEKLIYNKETLEAYLATLVHPDEAHDFVVDIDESFEVPKFIEDKNGALYALPYSYPVTGYGSDDTYELSDNGDGSYTFTVNYTVLEDDGTVKSEKSRDFKYVNVDGRWVLGNFRIIKQ